MTDLEIYKVYIGSLFKILWDYPESIYYILKNSEISEVKDNLSDFIVNSFFCNNISTNYLENNLLYIISMMLKDEIDQITLKTEMSLFLEETKTSFLLKQLIKMPDVQMYFRKIIYKMVEKIEIICSSKKINFNTDIIYEDINNFIQNENKKLGKKQKKSTDDLCQKYINTKIEEQSMNTNEEEEDKENNNNKIIFNENFKKYEKNIDIDELKNLEKEAEKNKKKDLCEYYSKLIENIHHRNCDDLYFITFLEKYEEEGINTDYLLYIYQNDFLNVISCLEVFIDDLLSNISIIPNSIKSICKILSILIRNKFKDITKIEENHFLSKFFIDKLLIPILHNPSTNTLLNDFVISGSTLDNILVVSIILKKLFSGNLFENNFYLSNGEEENFYTYFNRFILNQTEKIIYFFQKITEIQIPNFIEKYINNNLNNDYLYDYFEENPEDIYASISICFNLDNLSAIIKGLHNCNHDLFKLENSKVNRLKKIFGKFNSEEKMNELRTLSNNIIIPKNNNNSIKIKSKDKFLRREKTVEGSFEMRSFSKTINKIQTKETIDNYYIINEKVIEKKYENLFKIKDEIKGFYIDAKKIEKQRKLEENEKNIIKIKNYLINSLINYKLISRSSFKSEDNVFSILSQIRNHMNSPNFILNNNQMIPSNWSISSVLDYMQRIPEEYKANDYDKFFSELTQNLEDSINEFNFEKLFLFKKKIQYLENIQNYYSNNIKILEDINNNEIVKDFVENSFCPIEVKFCYDDDEDEKIFELKKININKKAMKDLDRYQKDEKTIFRTVASFVSYFPDLNKYQDKMDINPFEIISKLSINKKIFNYFDILKHCFIHEKNCSEENYDKIYEEKIKNYIMNKIYKKIYPREIEFEDSKLFEKTMHLSWVEPNMIIPEDTSLDVLDNILPDILEEFKKLNKAESPYIKLKCVKKIFEYIGVIVKFNDGGKGENREVGAEDITPFLNYVLIRACPVRILSDIKFIKLFMKNEGKFDYDFLNVEMMCKNILDSTYKNFHITESEYIKKCNEAINNNKNNNDKRFNEIINRFEIINI